MENRKHTCDATTARSHTVVRESIRYAVSIPLVLLLFATTLFAGGNGGNVFFGINLAKALIEHTDSIYLKINDSKKLYFNKNYQGPVLENLDLNKDHIVRVYFGEKIAQSWILNFSKLQTQSVVIWRSAGAWRMDPKE